MAGNFQFPTLLLALGPETCFLRNILTMEPLSIFSLTITILNILLSVIPSVIDKGEQIKNFAERFNRYLETLENCRMSMNVWVGRWEQDNASEYRLLFGRIGWWSIQERRDRIQLLLKNILEHLELKSPTVPKKKPSPLKRVKVLLSSHLSTTSIASSTSLTAPTDAEPVSDSAIEAWQIYVREDAQIRVVEFEALPKKPDVTVMKRIVGILYENQQLDRKIGELQKAIDGLHSFSRHCFYEMGHGSLDQDPEKDEIDESLQLGRLQRIAGELYKSYLPQKEQYQWTLELRFPQEVEAGNAIVKEIAKKGMIYFTVKHRPVRSGPLLAQELTVRHIEGAMTQEIPADPLNLAMTGILSKSSQTAELAGVASLEFSQDGTPIFWTKSLRFLLIKSRENEEVQKIFSLERARVAYGCSLWMIILWRTDWFANLCSCGFRSALYPNQTRLTMLPTVNEKIEDDVTRHEYVFRSQSLDNKEHPCPRRYSHTDKLYLLGILIAELYLSEAIDLDFVNGHLEPSNPQQFKSNSDIVKRLERYDEFGGKHPVLDAVEFCLRNARKKEWIRSQRSIKKSQVNALIKNVLVP